MSHHQPPFAPPDNTQMMYSRSTGSLHNRLRPQNENITASTSNLGLGGLNTIKPKNMMSVTHSTPNLLGTESGHPAPVPSKAATLLRNDPSHGTLGGGPRSLSQSHSAQVLLGKGTVPRPTSPAHKLADQIDTSEWDHETPIKEFAEFSFSPSRRHASPTKTVGSDGFDDSEGIDKANYIHVPRNSFLASLNLTQRQLYDLYKVPHTFFYLRVKENSSKDHQRVSSANHNHSHNGSPANTRRPHSNDFTQDGRGNAGSVYDLELVSLDQVDKNNYFTLSKEGVTQFRNKLSTFTGLSQWEREYRLFHKIANINFFKIYKRWKVSSIASSQYLLQCANVILF